MSHKEQNLIKFLTQVFIVTILLLKIHGFQRLYYTDRNPFIGKYDCTSQTSASGENFESEYCRYPIDSQQFVSNAKGKEECREDIRTFEQMRLEGINTKHLLSDFAPIDVIDRYRTYLENWNINSYVTNNDDYFCNCTDRNLQAFGRNCEYTFDTKFNDEELKKHSIAFDRIDRIFRVHQKSLQKTSTESYRIAKELCYTGISGCRTLSDICLQWNEICDGNIDCENAEDEVNCILLELEQCDPVHEYRCRNGICIPREMAFDGTYQCDDLTDEHYFQPTSDSSTNFKTMFCESAILSICYEHFCGRNWFSCGNGQCSSSLWTKSVCVNKRDANYVRSILLQSSTELKIISCWSFAICHLGFQQFFTKLELPTCTSIVCNQSEFLFPIERPIAHPSVYLIYQTNRSFTSSVTPDYICYDAWACHHVFQPTIIKFNRSCNSWKEIMIDLEYKIQNWTTLVFHIRQTFIPCLLPKPNNVNDSLFDCGPILISKHRLYDNYFDCVNGADEIENSKTCDLGVAQRFQCRNHPQHCILRTQVLDHVKNCPNGVDEIEYYNRISSDGIGPRLKRGTLEIVNIIDYQNICDGFIDIQIENDTDESDCPSIWKQTCDRPTRKCNFEWNCQNGQDELNCTYDHMRFELKGIALECNNKQQFYCTNRTTKQIECYSSSMAGDGHEDCLGAIDERIGGFCQSKYPTENDRRFRCGQSDLCISVKYLCDGVSDCKEVNNNDDEDLCPWRVNISLSQVQRTFMCKNRIFWATTVRCDDFNDCADGEDELFCHLDGRTRSSSIPPESLVIDVISLSNSLILTDPFQKDITWYCNGGLPVRNSSRLNELFCLCPYSYYGEQCEFQRRRVKIHISLIISDRYLEMNAVIKLVIYLINRNSLEIIDYKERLVMAQRNPFTSQIMGTRQHQVQLLFPTDNYFDAITFVKIDAFIVTKTSLEYQASWYYDLKFPFLPIQTHAVEFHLPAPTPVVGSCVHGQLRPYVNNMSRTWCHCNAGWRGAKCDQFDSICQSHTCSLGSICVPTKNYPICLCTLYNQGPSCRVQMDLSCLLNPCQNNGTCLRLYYLRSVSMCICQEHHTGTYCETEKRRVYISTESDLVEKYLRVSIMTIYFYSTLPFTDYFMLSSQYLRLLRNVQLNENIPPIFIAGYGPIQFGFAQFLTSLSDRFGEYFLILRQNHAYTYKIEVINTTIRSKNRCPHIRELFNSTILSMQPINRMKWYHEPCQNNYELACFFDEQLMCLCTRQHLTQCATFFHQITNCSERYRCLNDGLCVQESNINNPLDYFCICQECYFGDLCQFTTSQYSISLDSLIGQTIKTDVAFQEQPTIVIVSFIVVLISIVIGLLLNGFTILLFIYQNKCRETGSGLYILTTSCFGVLSLLVLGLKLISLVFNLFMSNKFGCMTIEYLLKYLPTVADWMNTFVSLERFWVTKKKTKFDKKKSRHIAKRVIPLSIFIILISLLHDPFHRESVVDLRLDYGRRAWCVVHFETQFIRIYNMIINIVHYICPFMISLIAIIFILIDFTRVRVKAKQQAFKLVFSEQLSLLKHWIISPIVLAILALPRIIFSLTFTCISKDTPWQHILIISYFIAFLPHISSLVIFVLPSKTYMKQLKIFIKIAR